METVDHKFTIGMPTLWLLSCPLLCDFLQYVYTNDVHGICDCSYSSAVEMDLDWAGWSFDAMAWSCFVLDTSVFVVS